MGERWPVVRWSVVALDSGWPDPMPFSVAAEGELGQPAAPPIR
jgi:hypothetical protein